MATPMAGYSHSSIINWLPSSPQRLHLFAEINDILVAALPAHLQPLVVKIHILDIQPHTVRYPDTRCV